MHTIINQWPLLTALIIVDEWLLDVVFLDVPFAAEDKIHTDTVVTKLAQDFNSIPADDAIPSQVKTYPQHCSEFVQSNIKFKNELSSCLNMRKANIAEIALVASSSVDTAARVTNAAFKIRSDRYAGSNDASSSRSLLAHKVSEGSQAFECAMSPITQQTDNTHTLFDNNEASSHNDTYHPTRRFIYTFENIEPCPASITNPWIVGGIRSD
ncbi:predicted protein [Lichtheimia corymbifera JMRC:FSU:9682]|uniref:Uncharacterized protein n=1 Tax=Lichtheimia corymbifera JMRC:FSU:9682 TaxID=1263082 RepID=A0A068RQG4_9FUNG|nr:predicted protein [Lichtheimia corymbifera JMRC:FSU:9682]